MTPQQFRQARSELSHTQVSLAAEWGITEKTIRRWEAGIVPVSPLAAYTIKLMLKDLNNG